jgi:carboxylesterase type B
MSTLVTRIILLAVLLAYSRSAPTVQINQGILIGTTNGLVDQFLGVPYANPPIGNLRWKAPAAPDPFNGAYDASYFRSACFQAGPFGNYELKQSEDCLYLNIYRPATANENSNLPVLVWIHGGGFYGGSAQLYESSSLSNYSQSIIVTINYRVNIFGFMVLPGLIQESPSLNYGLLDQQCALNWVQQNIAKFGGNPSKVMIDGESAGGMSVLLHNLMPQSWSLFDTSVIQSAGPWTLFSAQQASDINMRGVAQTNLCQSPNQTGAELITCLRALPARALLPLLAHVIAIPVVDNVQLTDVPLAMIQRGQARPGSFLIGQVDQEGNLFAFNLDPSMSVNATTFEKYVHMYALPSQAVAWYQDVIDTQGYWAALSAIMRDYYITCGTYFTTQSLASSPGTTVYSYLFMHHTTDWKYKALNATHEAELAYVFHNDFDHTSFNTNEELLSRQIVALWTAFNVYDMPSKNNYDISWLPYRSSTPYTLTLDVPSPTLNFDEQRRICQNWLPILLGQQ